MKKFMILFLLSFKGNGEIKKFSSTQIIRKFMAIPKKFGPGRKLCGTDVHETRPEDAYTTYCRSL